MPYSENNSYRAYFSERFGIPAEVLENYRFYEKGKSVWAFSGSFAVPDSAEVAGIRALRLGKELKPTTAFLRVVGRFATKNRVLLDAARALMFLKGESVADVCGNMRGYVVVLSEDVLGCGFCREGTLMSMVPRKYRPDPTWL